MPNASYIQAKVKLDRAGQLIRLEIAKWNPVIAGGEAFECVEVNRIRDE
jgi:hypothetical protein